METSIWRLVVKLLQLYGHALEANGWHQALTALSY
ncbi:hypothetical protein OROMI_023623 [Orobanche minor]